MYLEHGFEQLNESPIEAIDEIACVGGLGAGTGPGLINLFARAMLRRFYDATRAMRHYLSNIRFLLTCKQVGENV